MKKIKDMAEDELCRLIAQVCHRTTNPIESMMEAIAKHFERIEKKLEQEIKYPNAYKEHILRDIAELNRDIDKFLEVAKELKRKEESKRIH